MLAGYRQLVVLARHGHAVSTEEDPERPLSAAGRRQAGRVADWLARMHPAIEEVRHSGKARAQQTAEILAGQLGLGPAGIREVLGLAPYDEVESVALALEQGHRSVVLVGHLPFLSRLASRMLVGDSGRLEVRFADAGVAVLARVPAGWQLLAMVSGEMV